MNHPTGGNTYDPNPYAAPAAQQAVQPQASPNPLPAPYPQAFYPPQTSPPSPVADPSASYTTASYTAAPAEPQTGYQPQAGYEQQGYTQQGYPQQGYPQQAQPGYPQQPGYQQQEYQAGYAAPPYPTAPPMPVKKKKTGIIIVAAVLVLALAIGGTFGVLALLRSRKYDNAVADMNNGNYAEAYTAFVELEDYKDSAINANICDLYIRYGSGLDLMESGQYEEAKAVFQDLGEDFEDCEELIKNCDLFIAYGKAEDLYNSEEYFKAYNAFLELGNFEDSARRAEQCIQTRPSSSILIQGPAYAEGSVAIDIENNKNQDEIMLIYRYSDSQLWALIYIRSNETTPIGIEPGTYYFENDLGTNWFGEKDMFGTVPQRIYWNGADSLTFNEGDYGTIYN